MVGDIHGAHKALLQCFERSQFDPDKDLLISLGDVCDGWPEVHKVMDELLRIRNLKFIFSNHDQWTLKWFNTGWKGHEWVSQGGSATLESYQGDRKYVPDAHRQLLQNAPFFLELDNKLFVHGGIDPDLDITEQESDLLLWDRELLYQAVRAHKKNSDHRYGKWSDIFVGHTTTQVYKTLEPIHACNVWAVDTGSGWDGKLTMMDIDNHEYWQSDATPTLYPNSAGRQH